MAMANGALALILIMASLHVEISFGAVYKVGDSAGWTTIGNVDYKQWAASKTFELGDIISKFSQFVFMICVCIYFFFYR